MDYLITALLYAIAGFLFVRLQIALGACGASGFHALFWPLFWAVEILAYLAGKIMRRPNAA